VDSAVVRVGTCYMWSVVWGRVMSRTNVVRKSHLLLVEDRQTLYQPLSSPLSSLLITSPTAPIEIEWTSLFQD
jgi:hypothetical protein